MEDHLDNILYIVLLLVGIIASAFRNKKSRKPVENKEIFQEEENAPHHTGKKKNVFEEFFSEFMDEEQPKQEQPAPPIVEEPKWQPQKYTNLKEEYLRRNEDRAVKTEINEKEEVEIKEERIEDHKPVRTESKTDPIKETEIGKVLGSFDLRKAVIYSEILNKKYE